MLSFLLPSPLPHHEIFITGLPTTLSCSFPFLIVSDQKKREKGRKKKTAYMVQSARTDMPIKI